MMLAKAWEDIGHLVSLAPFSSWLDDSMPDAPRPTLLRDARGEARILRMKTQKGGYWDIWLQGQYTGNLVSTGSGDGPLEDYARYYPHVFAVAPREECPTPAEWRALGIDLDSAFPRALDVVRMPGSPLKWYCRNLANRQAQDPNWCLPCCISIVSVRFDEGPLTEAEAAGLWGQPRGVDFDWQDQERYRQFKNAVEKKGMQEWVAPASSPDSRGLTYARAASAGRPVVYAVGGHAYVCTGICERSLDNNGRQFKALGYINPQTGAECWVAAEPPGLWMNFAFLAPGPDCPAGIAP